MRIHEVNQGSEEWLALRCASPTCSELDQLLTPAGEPRDGQMPKTYLARKLCERWQGFPEQSFSGGNMEQGTLKEESAIPYFELFKNVDIDRVGFITTDDGSCGCSPDGTFWIRPEVGEHRQSGLEVKCPTPTVHAKWLLRGGVPPEHVLQVQGGMYVTGWCDWFFVSFCLDYPPLIVHVIPDPDMQAAIHKAVTEFNIDLENAYKTLVRLNGGPPRRRVVEATSMDDDVFCALPEKQS